MQETRGVSSTNTVMASLDTDLHLLCEHFLELCTVCHGGNVEHLFHAFFPRALTSDTDDEQDESVQVHKIFTVAATFLSVFSVWAVLHPIFSWPEGHHPRTSSSHHFTCITTLTQLWHVVFILFPSGSIPFRGTVRATFSHPLTLVQKKCSILRGTRSSVRPKKEHAVRRIHWRQRVTPGGRSVGGVAHWIGQV